MKIIDEKGRLFGKINVIDFLVVLFLFCLLPAFYFGYKVVFRKPVLKAADEVSITINTKCEFVKLSEEIIENIAVGDKALDANGNIIGEIISIDQNSPYQYIASGEYILVEDATLKNISAEVRLNLISRYGTLYYDNYMINRGLVLKFKTHKYTCSFTPFMSSFSNGEKRLLDIPVTIKNLDGDILKLVSVGDKEIDEYGNVLAEIINIGQIENNILNLELEKGYIVEAKETNRKQVQIIIRMQCIAADKDTVYYKNIKLSRNETFIFKTDKYRVECMPIISFKEEVTLKRRWLLITAKFNNIDPEIINVVKDGDKEENTNNETVAVISRILENKPKDILMLKDNTFVELNHPFQRDLVALLEIECIEKDNTYYFKNYPVKMGNTVVFSTDLYSINGTIIGVEIKNVK